MFTSIKTSKDNKELVSQLTRRLNLGAENTIARLAFAYSLSINDNILDPKDMKDAQGKEYSSKVLFGDQIEIYVALVSVQYGIPPKHKNVAKLIKMHLDDGLELIYDKLQKKESMSGMDFIINNIEKGLSHFN